MTLEFDKYKYVVCPDCRGLGFSYDKVCPKCQGLGAALIIQDQILYWGKYYDSANITYEQFTRVLRGIFNMLLAIISFSGIFVLAYWGYKHDFQNLVSFDYWLTPSIEKFYFWLTLLVALYLYYRLEQEITKRFGIMRKSYRLKNDFIGDEMTWPKIWDNKKSMIDISTAFTPDAVKSVQSSWELAKHFEHNEVLPIHFFGILPQYNKSAIILARLGINFETFKQKVSKFLTKNIISRGGNPSLSPYLRKIILHAYVEGYLSNRNKVDIPELVLALSSPEKFGLAKGERDDIEEILIDYEVNYQKMKNVVSWVRIQEQLRTGLNEFRAKARYKPKSGLDRAMTAMATPLLDQYSDDLTLKAKLGHLFPCIGREDEIEHIYRIMEGSRTGVLLIGNQGVGKTSVIEGLAQKMVAEDVPEILQDKRLVSLNLSRLLAGADASAAEERMLMICDEVMRARNIVLVLENIHNLCGITVGGDNSLDLSEVFAQILSKHVFYCLASTTSQSYTKALEQSSLSGAFQNVKVEELELNQAICVLEVKSGPIEYQNKVYFSYDSIEKAAILSARYIQDRYLPEKALEIMEQVAIKVRKERGENKVIKAEDVAEIVSKITNIPVTKVTEKESEKLLHLEDFIHERMIGQEEAVNLVASSLRRARAELREGKRPIASLLFLGPTGVGKTELAKSVADVYFGNENSMTRIDMSEYQSSEGIGRLIGSASSLGYLTEAVRKNPFSLVLFDEIEKAHPDILNLFLQMMDDGRLTDSQGRTIDFTNTILIMTSNTGAQYIQDEIKKGTPVEKIKQELINEKLRVNYRPEFLNRFDGIVVFKPLGMQEVIQIARLMIDKIIKNLDEKGITFAVTDEAVSELAEIGYDPKFGARPLRRTIQEKIDDVLARNILTGKIKRRDKVIFDVGGEVKIESAEPM